MHRHQNLNPKGYPPLVYSGSIERIDFGERKEDKGFCLVTIEDKEKTSYEFIKTPTRPFIQIEVKLKSGPGQTDQLIKEISTYNIKNAIVKILYHIPPGKKDQVDLKIVQRICSDALYVVGIIPIRKPDIRERRIGAMKVTMSLENLLTAYFDTKPELKEKKDELIEKTLLLWQDYQNQEQKNER